MGLGCQEEIGWLIAIYGPLSRENSLLIVVAIKTSGLINLLETGFKKHGENLRFDMIWGQDLNSLPAI